MHDIEAIMGEYKRIMADSELSLAEVNGYLDSIERIIAVQESRIEDFGAKQKQVKEFKSRHVYIEERAGGLSMRASVYDNSDQLGEHLQVIVELQKLKAIVLERRGTFELKQEARDDSSSTRCSSTESFS
jgi:hypothetical protein